MTAERLDHSPDAAAPAQDEPAALAELARRISHRFGDPALLERAVTHRSWCAEHPGNDSNERLEFLGDAVLGLVVTDHLYRVRPDLPEGALAKARASVVSAATLAEVAGELGLGEVVRLGRGEDRSGGREKPSILADAFEAVLGAVWIDGGLQAAAPLVLELLAGRIEIAADGPGGHDYKTRLQELAAQRFEELPEYRLDESGPDHDKRFRAEVRIAGSVRGSGTGRSKKEAEQAAARAAWDELLDDVGEATSSGEGEWGQDA